MNERTFHARDAHILENPERLQWLPPAEVLVHLPIHAGMTVADVGAGTGYFTLPIAESIGSTGKVFAVDFQKAMLDILKQKQEHTGRLRNVELVEGTATHTTLSDNCVDLVLMANIWHELDDHDAVLTECARILHHTGKVAILDWRPDVQQPPGPPLHHRISAPTVVTELVKHRWVTNNVSTIGMYSYLVLASRPSREAP
jgi:ubiquinone/menaquinone biosynthesis C-methylase UbiE